MNDEGMDEQQVRGELEELERQLIAMGNMVESLFADSVVALMERNPNVVPELREEDQRTHERWLEIDKLCVELLCNGKLGSDQIRFVSAAIKIAADLKRMADESLHLGEGIRSSALGSLPAAESLASIPRLAELTQSMLNDVIEAFINRDAGEAAGLHLVYGELAALRARSVDELGDGMLKGSIPIQLGIALVGVSQRLQRMGDEVLDISNLVCRLEARTREA